MVDCPACKRSHGKLSPGIYKCPCTAQFRVDKNPAKKNPARNPWGYEEKRRAREAEQQRDIEEAEADRIRLTPKFHTESPARSAACPSCGHFHRGTMLRREELQKIRKASGYLRADYSQLLAQITERVAQCYEATSDNPMGRTKPKPKHSPYDRAQRRTRKTARAGSGAPASDGNGAYPSPKMRRDNPKLTGEDRKKAEKYLNQLRSLGSVSMDKDSLAKRLEARLDLYPHEAKSIVFDWYKKIKANPDAPEGFWDFPPVFAYHYTSEGPRYDRPIPEAQRYFEDDEWKPYYASSKRGGNGHIADPFTPRRHFGMFTYKGNRAVELFAQRWRDSFLSEESGSLTERGFIWDGGDKLLSELEQLASLPGMEEARDTDVREQIISYVLGGDRTVEMGGETYHYPHMVTPDYYSEPADEY